MPKPEIEYLDWDERFKKRLKKVEIEGHEYFFDEYGFSFMFHNENCPCKCPAQA